MRSSFRQTADPIPFADELNLARINKDKPMQMAAPFLSSSIPRHNLRIFCGK